MQSFKRKICIVGPSKRFLSGISYYTIKLANSMSESSDISVIYFRKLLPEFLFPGRDHVGKNISDLELLPKVQTFDGMDYNNPLTWFNAFRFLRKQNPDYIILQWWTSSVAHIHLMIKIFSKFTGSKLIIEFHEVVDPFEDNIFPIRLYSKMMGKILRKNLDAYITHSESDKQLVSKRYYIDLQNIHVIPLGFLDQYNTSMDKQTAKDILSIKEEFTILTFGLIRKYKGIKYLIQAFKQLPEDIIWKSRLLIVGEIWDDREELLEQIKTSPYAENITIVDEYIPDDMVSIYFSAANVVVLPYLRASQSGIAHIAMSFGKPVVVSEVGGLKESMADYEGTTFVSPQDVEGIKYAILEQLVNKNIYNPPERTWDTIVKRYNDLIKLV